MDFTVNLWAVLVAAVAYFALGAIWYMVLGNPWMTALGTTRADLGAGASPVLYVATFVLEAVAVFALAVLLGNSQLAGGGGGAALGLLVGAGIWVMLLSVTFLYERRRTALFFIDGGYHLVALTAAGAILGAWPPA